MTAVSLERKLEVPDQLRSLADMNNQKIDECEIFEL